MKTLSNPAERGAILARLSALHPGSQRAWGTMTAPEMICHLSDTFRTALGELPSHPFGGIFFRTVVKWTALYLPVTWPKNIPNNPKEGPRNIGTPPDDFADDVAALRLLCERFAKYGGAGSWAIHPVFGELSDAQWHRWGYLHMDHHLRQFGA